MPTQAKITPKTPLMIPLSMDLPEKLVTSVNPMKVRAKYSGGPKDRATLASGGAIRLSVTVARVPAVKDAMAAIPSAGPARPFLAIW